MFAQSRILPEYRPKIVSGPPDSQWPRYFPSDLPVRTRAHSLRSCSVGDDAPMDRFDVVVVGGGPAGASAAYWLAEAGHAVVVVEKKRFPREKTCGDGLTPRAVRQLNEMGLAERLEEYH